RLTFIPHAVDDLAGGGQAFLQRPVDTDAAPAVGVVRSSEEKLGINVVEKTPPLGELALAQGSPGLASPLIGNPVVAGGIDNLEVIAPLVDNSLGVFDGVEINIGVVVAKADQDGGVVIHEVFGAHHGHLGWLWCIAQEAVVAFDLDPDLRTLGVPLLIDNALYSIGQGRGEFNISQRADRYGADDCRCFDDFTRFGSYGRAVVVVFELDHRGSQADVVVEVAGDAIVKRAHAVIQLPLQSDVFHHAVAIIR